MGAECGEALEALAALPAVAIHARPEQYRSAIWNRALADAVLPPAITRQSYAGLKARSGRPALCQAVEEHQRHRRRLRPLEDSWEGQGS